jgi:hypothetical protein
MIGSSSKRMKKLDQRVFSEADFERMTWHDVTIHAIGFESSKNEILFDIDYILEWLQQNEKGSFEFRLAPATLIFENIHSAMMDFSPDPALGVSQILRHNPRSPRNRDFIKKKEEWTWTIELHEGCITFAAVGFRMFIRREPIITSVQRLELPSRGGLSFAEHQT